MPLFDVSDLGELPKAIDRPKEKEVVKVRREDIDFSNQISFCRHIENVEGYDDFTCEKYPNGIVFYDFEVFAFDWLVVILDPVNKTKDVIANDRRALIRYHNSHQEMVWTGYNNKGYDVIILKAILSGVDPKEISDKIVSERKRGWELSQEYKFKKVRLYSYDVMAKKMPPESLKLLEAFMGDDIEETEVDFNLQRLLTKEELVRTMKYCSHDVAETVEVFRNRISDYNTQIALIETFGFPMDYVSKTKGQITAAVTDCEKKEHDDEFDIRIVPVVKLEKYKYVQEWFEAMCAQRSYSNPLDEKKYYEIVRHGKQVVKENNGKKTCSFQTDVCGIPHIFAWGGVHGASEKPVHTRGKIAHADVTSYYPSEMLKYGFFTRNSKHPEKFREVYDTRVALKKAGKKKESDVYKVVLNSQFGITKDRNSEAFDSVQANNICINGQLLLLDLLEHLEKRLGNRFELIQSNTDGIIIKLAEDEKTEKIFNHVHKEWCERTGMGMGVDWISIYDAKDVNNYVFQFYGEKERNLLNKLYDKIVKKFPSATLQGNDIVIQ